MNGLERYRFFAEVSAFTDPDAYSDWIWARICESLPLSEKIDPEFQSYLHQAKMWSTTEGLGNVYQHLADESRKSLFRQSIGEILLKHGDEDVPREAFAGLIYLMGRTRAVESLEALVPTIGRGFLGRKHGEYLLYSTIAILEDLAPTPPVKEVTLKLVNSPYFDEGYLLGAIGILVKCDPLQTGTLLSEFSPRIANLRRRIQELNQEEQDAYSKVAGDLKERIQRYTPATSPDVINQTLFG